MFFLQNLSLDKYTYNVDSYVYKHIGFMYTRIKVYSNAHVEGTPKVNFQYTLKRF